MEALRDWGADVVGALEGWRPTFDGFFTLVTGLGDIPFFIVFLAALYWVVDRDLAVRIGILLGVSIFANVWLKEMFGQPRPVGHDPTLTPLIDVGPLGFPSGHAQSAMVIWGSVFLASRHRWVRLACVAALVLVPFSRLYLGVHFPHDIVGGYIVGGVVLWFGVRFVPPLLDRFDALALPLQLSLAIGLPTAATLLADNPDRARGGAAFAGGFVGLVIERRWIRSASASGWIAIVRRLLIGFVVVAPMAWLGFGDLGRGMNAIGFFLIGLWVAAGAPWVFRLLERRR